MKKLIVLCFGILVFAQAHAYEIHPMDSIGIERVGDKTFIIHQVDPGETLFGISRRYQTAINDILQANEQLKDGLKAGQRIRIPYITKAAIPTDSRLHKVAPGETLFAISRQYGVTVNDLMAWNQLKGNDISVGQALIIKGVAEPEPAPAPVQQTPPVQVSAPVAASNERAANNRERASAAREEARTKEEPKAATAPSNPASSLNNRPLPGDWITHTVAQGETLFSIARAYDAKVENLINWNSLSSNNLTVGQKLKVGREPESNVPVVTSSVPIVVNNQRTEGQLAVPKPEISNPSASTAYKNIKETGLAEVIEGTGNHKKYLVLHRTAPVGTIMRVRNEENDITIFARVVGKLPDTGDNSRLVIKLSKAAYDQLRAVNARFPVEIAY
ncbi:LysM peptidoglycan-binding domain-containing protein [Cecembia calidifontis]|uniref:LysM domain-containing protein n=1 Tax=Cecembia calidifontis TaxID=1187080 RepID=A0A4Q7PDY8_9BACT|nr:LysM peptidoglycan-binding domain-containing protein [Cecembia calidifontis]RZS98495.1 LysM domain-containing protein [Cecembia calidifontis]